MIVPAISNMDIANWTVKAILRTLDNSDPDFMTFEELLDVKYSVGKIPASRPNIVAINKKLIIVNGCRT